MCCLIVVNHEYYDLGVFDYNNYYIQIFRIGLEKDEIIFVDVIDIFLFDVYIIRCN